MDSIDAAQTEKETKRQMTEMGVGDLPRIMSKSMRTLSKVCVDKKVLYIFINQIRMKIGVMYGNPETTSGGNALPYYHSSIRLRVTSKPSSSLPNALEMKVSIKKNKFAPALNKAAEFTFMCGKGTDEYNDTIEFAKSVGLIRFAGSAVKLSLPDEEEVTLCTGGKLGARNHLQSNPNDYERIRSACYKAAGIKSHESGTIELYRMTQKAKQKLQVQPDEDFYLTCAATGEDLLSIEDGITRVHISHGQCASCGHFSL